MVDVEGLDTLDALEQRRQQLEQQISELDKLLGYWRNSELDYEILKEDVSELSDDYHMTELYEVGHQFVGRVLKIEEVKQLLTDNKGVQRSRQQVLELLRHRLDYVDGNVKSLSARRDAIQDKLNGVDVLLQPDMVDDEGLPLTEITEQLDDDDNIISSSTRAAGSEDHAELLQKLETEGLVEPKTQLKGHKSSGTADAGTSSVAAASELQPARPVAKSRAANAQAVARAKADQLVADLEIADDDDEGGQQMSAQMLTATLMNSIADIDHSNMTSLGPALKLKDASEFTAVPRSSPAASNNRMAPVMPENESPEDAAMRREMLEYSLNEVGSVVAEMQLDGEDSDDFDDDEDEDENDDEDEDEDEFGRSKKPMISAEYRQQMLELEKQLNAKALQNVGPAPGRISPSSSEEEDERPAQTRAAAIDQPAQKVKPVIKSPDSIGGKPGKSKQTKGVRFAENLDISDASSTKLTKQTLKTTPISAPKPAPSAATSSNPLADEVQERQPKAKLSVTPEAITRKVSRFKAAKAASEPSQSASSTSQLQPSSTPKPRGPLSDIALQTLKPITSSHAMRFAGPLLSTTAEQPRDTPEGPEGKTHADVLERPPSETQVMDPEDGDAGLTRQALAVEYYRQRNNEIYRQGGFKAEDPAEVPIDEDGEEVGPKVSRFKAARLKRTG